MPVFADTYQFTCAERFLKYVKYDTESDPDSTTYPSTEKQKTLLRELAEELKAMGLKDAHMDEWGYVIATLPSNVSKNVPAIAFIAHVDTSPQVSGANVKPKVIRNYGGGDIPLANGHTIGLKDAPELKDKIGYDIITTDGSTLLGADDKAGIAEIMDAVNYLVSRPELKHGTIKVCFTPDEELGRGTEKLDVHKLGARFGYTIDSGGIADIRIENFNADGVTIKFHGMSAHPGYAKAIMINSIKPAAAFIDSLPRDTLSPETTEDQEGFVHCLSIAGNEELTTLKFIVRDFERHKLKEYEDLLRSLAQCAVDRFPGSSFDFEVREQYRNMKEVLDKYPEVTEYALEAMRRLGMDPRIGRTRGGTDGARLSFMGVPMPNLFDGAYNIHSPIEWVAVRDMELAVRTIVELVKVWEERSR
jgi:tripeptide aminopeptidase